MIKQLLRDMMINKKPNQTKVALTQKAEAGHRMLFQLSWNLLTEVYKSLITENIFKSRALILIIVIPKRMETVFNKMKAQVWGISVTKKECRILKV